MIAKLYILSTNLNSIYVIQICRSELVIAVDIDPRKIGYAQHNAAIYGVNNWIDFIQGDSFAIAPKLKVWFFFVIVFAHLIR